MSRLPPRPIQAIDPVACRLAAECGAWYLRSFLTNDQQDMLVVAARELKTAAPLVHPTMRDGTPLSVRVSSFGARGWWGDREGFRYVPVHPTTRKPFPPIPEDIREITGHALDAAAHYSALCLGPAWRPGEAWGTKQGLYAHVRALDTCLVNHYGPGADLGWHVDKTELDRVSPIVTFSLGATCTFDIKVARGDAVTTFRHELRSGDAIVMAGPARLAEHRVTHIRADEQADLFGGNYNPIASSAPGTRLSFTIRRTGH